RASARRATIRRRAASASGESASSPGTFVRRAISAGVYTAAVLASFLLPARNAQATLREALGDVLAQRGVDFEVVCVDDASTDDTPRILAETPGVRVVRGEGRGLVAALNEGLRHCRGEFIARMDADDRCEPHRLRHQLEM